MKKSLILLSLALLISCTGNYEKNIAELDEVYGKCKNPARTYTEKQYKQCVISENAKGESFFGLQGDLGDLISGKDKETVYQSTVNTYLWNGALDVTNTYPLKIADNQGGFIETDWINNGNSNRCLIKIRILSNEMISTGVSTKFVCETKVDGVWKKDNENYVKEEQQLTLKILENASNLKNTSF
tara:strand:- start:1704 stop:2258 length:555 start_codon:yes stop_codon:yes gene_type:complete